MEYVHILKPTTKFTLAMLADRADPFMDAQKTRKRTDGCVECWPSIADLMHRTNQSKSTILRQLKELEKLGLIKIENRWTKNAQGMSRQTSNRYVINLPDMLAGRFMGEESSLGVKMTPKESGAKHAGQPLSVKMTPKEPLSVKKRASLGVSSDTPIKDQGLTTTPSPQPPVRSERDRGSVAPTVGEPSGSRGGEETLHEWTDRLRTIALALIGEAVLPDGVTNEELQAVRELEAQHRAHALEALPEAASDVITPVEAETASTDDVASESTVLGQETPAAERGKATGAADLSQAELVTLAREVLPAPMQAMGPQHLARIGHAIDQRLHAGWSKDDVTLILAMRQLPSNVRNLTALVMARLRDDVPLDQPPISAGLGQHSSFEASLMPSRKMAPEKRAAIDACELCDHNGFTPTPDGTALMRCTHSARKEAI
ncbi:helix-turn-helix domain-containing protein [Corynebacterium riegelii]|uniref:helix-turn-helix domain-containing protein n=1 Tax=Corynebacterium riegelii TaxID=156976 RepID=UPI00288C166B|nr:helix-turn-helix domain-containing protein [Corynebacterium riegelii]